jgi:low temperature requirement protein LtrA
LAAVTGSLSLLSIVSLWILYFGGSDRLVASTADPIRSARLAMNGVVVVVVAGLIAPVVGQEIVIVQPTVTHRPP